MPGSPPNIMTDPYHTYPDRDFMLKIEQDLKKQFCYGWLEDYLDNDIDGTVAKLITNSEETRRVLAALLAQDAGIYLVENKII